MSDTHNACTASDAHAAQVRALYTELALRPDDDFGWGKGKENARRLGYEGAWLARLPDEVWASAAAVANPFALGPIRPGATVVDLGCGAGADACVAALMTGDAGRVVAVDSTPAMVDKARLNTRVAGLAHIVLVYESDMTRVPLPPGQADVVISNGAINLATDKAAVFAEAYRLLRPGGRLQLADMVRDPAQVCAAAHAGSWADCVAGTLAPDAVIELLRAAGFADAELTSLVDYRTAPSTIAALFYATKP